MVVGRTVVVDWTVVGVVGGDVVGGVVVVARWAVVPVVVTPP